MRLSIVFAFLFFSFAASAQYNPAALPPESLGASTILLQTSDSAKTALKSLARVLVLQGYTLDKQDYELGYITTSLIRSSANSPAAWRLKAVVNDKFPAAITLTGDYVSASRYGNRAESMRSEKTVTYRQQTFLAADAVAKQHPHLVSVSYPDAKPAGK